MLPIVQELIVVEGVHDERTIKQTVHATVLVLGGWGAKRAEVAHFLKKAEETGRGILFFLDTDETGTRLESHLLSCLTHPDRSLSALLGEEISSRHGKIGLEHAKPKDVLKALHRAGATFLAEKPKSFLSNADLVDLDLKGKAHSTKLRAKVKKILSLSQGNAKHLLGQLNFLAIKREELEAILNKTDPV